MTVIRKDQELNLAEKSYYEELCSQVSTESDDTFVSFVPCDLDESFNLVSMIATSEYPLVLCAFLEAGHYKADDFQVPFTFFEVPSVEEVEKVLADYSGKLPDFLELRSQNGFSSHLDCLSWSGIQYARYFIHQNEIVYLNYKVTLPSGTIFHGKSSIPVDWDHTFSEERAVALG